MNENKEVNKRDVLAEQIQHLRKELEYSNHELENLEKNVNQITNRKAEITAREARTRILLEVTEKAFAELVTGQSAQSKEEN